MVLKSNLPPEVNEPSVPTALGLTRLVSPPEVPVKVPAVIAPLPLPVIVPAEFSVTVETDELPVLTGWLRIRFPEVVVCSVIAPPLVVMPETPPTVPIVRSRLSLRKVKAFPAPVTLAASVPTWLASVINTGPTAVTLSEGAMTGGSSVTAPPETSVTVPAEVRLMERVKSPPVVIAVVGRPVFEEAVRPSTEPMISALVSL